MRKTMMLLLAATVLGFGPAASAAPTTPLTKPATTSVAVADVKQPATKLAVADCQAVGSDVSALIDKKLASPNIDKARALFNLGLMECMDGEDADANGHYAKVRELLARE